MAKVEEQVVEYDLKITMPKSLSDKLVKLSEQAGEDDETVFLVNDIVIKSIKRRKVKGDL